MRLNQNHITYVPKKHNHDNQLYIHKDQDFQEQTHRLSTKLASKQSILKWVFLKFNKGESQHIKR